MKISGITVKKVGPLHHSLHKYNNISLHSAPQVAVTTPTQPTTEAVMGATTWFARTTALETSTELLPGRG